MAAFVLKSRERDIFDTGPVAGVARVATDGGDLAEEPAKEVNIVDRVLDEGATAGLLNIGAPGTAVMAVVGEELVVPQMGRQERAQGRLRKEILHDREDGRVAQDEPHLVDDSRGFHIGHHLADRLERLRERLFAEDVEPTPGGLRDERRVLGGLRADVDGIQAWVVEERPWRIRHRGRAGEAGEVRGTRRVAVADGVVEAGDVFRAERPAQVAGMEAADMATADESDDGFGHGNSWGRAGRAIYNDFTCGLPNCGETLPEDGRYSDTRARFCLARGREPFGDQAPGGACAQSRAARTPCLPLWCLFPGEPV